MFNLTLFQATQFHDYLFTLAVFVSIPILAVSAGFLVHYYATKPIKSVNSAEALMTEICAAHQIRSRDQRLLSKIAELAGVSHPATMTAIPEVFDAALQSADAKHPFSRAQSARLGQIRDRLFGPVS